MNESPEMIGEVNLRGLRNEAWTKAFLNEYHRLKDNGTEIRLDPAVALKAISHLTSLELQLDNQIAILQDGIDKSEQNICELLENEKSELAVRRRARNVYEKRAGTDSE